ncbi:MAG: tetratricopeptide repeat protein, partial [Planctomycetota bacterium]
DCWDGRDAWLRSRALLATGQRAEALAAARLASEAGGGERWDVLLAAARAERFLGEFERAAQTLVRADRLASAGDGTEPAVLVELGELYFEAYGEVDDPQSKAHSPAELFREALELAPGYEPALLGLYDLHRKNWMRQSRTSGEILDEILSARPASIPALVRRASAALDDGALPRARETLARLDELAPGNRELAAERATLAWVEHRRDDALAELEALTALDPADGTPERTVGKHLLELYRFAEGLEFLERSVERDASDWTAWTELGRARANTGDEAGGLEALEAAEKAARGRRDAWRANMQLVLSRMRDRFLVLEGDELTFAWEADADEVLRTYLVPFYEDARRELSERYGFTPDPVRIEVFRRWDDFSVRSTGFQGFPALGVCFGPVVTAVSPLSELRGSFSWARTSYHEFTHVIHLGISHNRCPRWVTEGIATWEEGVKNESWWRNMRRDLVDARANGTIVPVRELNSAFRSQRVLFAYYQSGLLIQMLVEEHGFPPIVRLLESFDRGLDLDESLRKVYRRRPEDLDREFAAYVDEYLAPLRIEPRWQSDTTFRQRFALSRRPPEKDSERDAWQDAWVTVAWGFHQQGQRVDADEALRVAALAGELPPRGLFLRGERRFGANDPEGARRDFQAGLDAGGEDFRVRLVLADLAEKEGDVDLREEHLLAAERNFPGFERPELSAELRLAELYEAEGRVADAMEARRRWLRFNAGELAVRGIVATWLAEQGRHADAAELFSEANEVDPFRRSLHAGWGRSLVALGEHADAEREFRVALLVPQELDADWTGELPPFGWRAEDFDGPAELLSAARKRWQASEPELMALRARALVELERVDEARSSALAALAIEPDQPVAREVLDRVGEGQ